jgi:hypothetical protein
MLHIWLASYCKGHVMSSSSCYAAKGLGGQLIGKEKYCH